MSASNLRDWCRARIAAPRIVHVELTGETREECDLRRPLPAPQFGNRVQDEWLELKTQPGVYYNPAFPEVRISAAGELLRD